MALADGEYRALIQKRLREDFRQLPDAERRGTLKIGEEGVHWVSDLKPETNFFLSNQTLQGNSHTVLSLFLGHRVRRMPQETTCIGENINRPQP